MQHPKVHIEYPSWIDQLVNWNHAYISDEEKMRLAIELSRENILHGTGGPFGSAIFEIGSNRLIAVGINLVVSLKNSVLHGEVVALMMAEARLNSFSLRSTNMPRYELFTSCDPCAMCLGAILWSGLKRVVCGASRKDAERCGFDEGPVFKRSYDYLRSKDIEIVHKVCREEARSVIETYVEQNGIIYNGL
jgi:tRNA(Arg) A34 adenosine deaminase TadA